MAWTYLAELEGSLWPYLPGSDLLPIVKLIDTAKPFCYLGWQKGQSPRRLSGTTCEPCLATCSRRSISSMEGSHARISVLQAMEQAWKESAQVWSSRYLGLFSKRDRPSSFWKMCRPLGRVEESEWSKNWPRSGMTVDGTIFPLLTWERRTKEKDGSYWPTATTVDAGSYFNKSLSQGAANRPTLGAMAKYNLWPTPMARDWKGSGGVNRASMDLSKAVGGKLSPQWVEWLMGYPAEWTVCEPWVTPLFPSRRAKHLFGSQASKYMEKTA